MPDTARLVDRQYSAALRGILKHMNKESDNFFAEMLLKGLGKDFYGEGSTAAGTRASKAALHALGVKTGTYVDPGRLRAELRQPAHRRGRASRCSAPCASATTSTTSTTRWRSPARTARCTTACAARRPPATRAPRPARSTSPSASPATSTSANDHLVAFSILMNGGSVGTSDWTRATTAQDKIVVALAKASLPGEPVLAVTPVLRQHSVSAVETVHGVGGRLKPGVQP